ncbi:putative disease resistance protein RDL6 [Camellia lanceoleosa]|uniref:Disease resistance protein RDL6 n=1 Tax=Camellia lanceoleosa TaxID=1840588 RepID=A0ACC0FII4_9ERIC|nr:putative disease resistance protein RDL6 [Camellia lanceoleosa]
MADMVLTAVLKKLVDIAGNLIVKEGSRLSQLKTDILWIENEMSHIRSYLKDVDTKQWGSSGAINFLGDIWDLAYDMENIIDTYFPKLTSSSGRNDWKRHLGWFKSVKCIRNFAVEIEGIKKRVENINRVRQTYGIKERGGGHDKEDGWDPRQSFPHIDEENIIGFDEHIQNLVAKVTDDQDLHCRVVSITGMAGLGKTTLAKRVYKSVQQSFQCSAWIYVSQQPNIKELLRDIGRQVGLEENKCKHNVEANLFEFLSQKRVTIHGINFSDYVSLNHQAPKLRAMLYFGEGMYNPRRNRYKDFLSQFKFLHVLSVRYYYLPTSFPNEISNLNHLSYLKLAAAVAEIPYTICNLKSLMTLDLSGCDVVIIPNLIWKMQQLRHILLPDYCNYICKAPSFREVSVPNLQTLQGMSTSLFEAQYLRKLNNLRELVVAHSTESIIEVLSGATPVSHGLEKLSLLDPWSLEWMPIRFRTFNLSGYENLSKLSLKVRVECLQHDKFPPNLTMLTLKYTYLKEDPIDTLKKLPKLKILKLCYKSYNGKEMVCFGEHGNFPELEVLRIEDMRNLGLFIVEEGGMPKLKDFSFIDCNPKTRIPNRIKSILMIYRLKEFLEEGCWVEDEEEGISKPLLHSEGATLKTTDS